MTKNTNEKILENGIKIRKMDLGKDYEQLVNFFDSIFINELEAKGGTIREMLKEVKGILPLFKIIGIVKKKYRYFFGGFLAENSDNELVGTTNIGNSGNYWEISMVATHPESRRQGISGSLLNIALNHAITHGAKKLMLEVLIGNKPAEKLYVNLGFFNYDVKSKLKLSSSSISDKTIIAFPSHYKLIEIERNKKTILQRFNLAKRVEPEGVQAFLPIDRKIYFKPLSIRFIRVFVKLVFKMKENHWAIHQVNDSSTMLAHASILYARSDKGYNQLNIMIDPNHNANIIRPLISFLINEINQNQKFEVNTLLEIRTTDSLLLDTLQEFKFELTENYNIMGKNL